MKFLDLPKELQQLTQQAEEYAIVAIQNEIEFSPYIYYPEKKMVKIQAEDIEEAIDTAYDLIEDSEQEKAIFVYHDHIELKDGLFDAIVTQIHSEDEDNGYSFALIYRYNDNKTEFLNERIFLGGIRNALFL